MKRFNNILVVCYKEEKLMLLLKAVAVYRRKDSSEFGALSNF
jgi:hypothetical protein